VTVALLFGRQRRVADLAGTYVGQYPNATADQIIPPRSVVPSPNLPAITTDKAMRHSAVWACLRLRANLISAMPVDIYREIGGLRVEVPKPPIFVQPGGEFVDWQEHIYSSQVDLDRAGNSVGLITERNAAGLPSRVDLMPISLCSMRWRESGWYWLIDGNEYDRAQVWHEKQYTVSGLPVGLSPVAYAAWQIGEYLSITDFALTWFGGGGIPRGHLRNKQQTMSPGQAELVKARFKSTVASGDVFVTGADWEYSMIQAEQTGKEWLEAKRASIVDVARFFDVPVDMIDGAVAGQAITYANVTQRNMQFLVMHLAPTIARRENAMNRLLPKPRFMKFNTSSLLRLDDETRAQVIAARINSRTLTPNEARELENLPPLTTAQVAELWALFGDPNNPPDEELGTRCLLVSGVPGD
jgi:HK97 family phage portal protein